ncbi:MAG: ribonuclease HII [Patescibacteria group bacterium]
MITPTLKLEQSLWRSGYSFVCGIDEVGRGSFAGPVCVGAVIFSKECVIPDGICDSKMLRPRTRERLSEEIKKCAEAWAVSEISVKNINKLGIGKATQMAFRKAVKTLEKKPDFVLVDAFYIKHLNRKRQKVVKDGDEVCASISAASIIAKVYRDKLMKKLSRKYPKYGLAKHKGYGTKKHQEAIKKYGLSRIHRKSFDLSRFLSL